MTTAEPLARRGLLAAACALPITPLGLGAALQEPAEDTSADGDEREPTPLAATVVLVRHAEKVEDGSADPPLTDAGAERAARLADLLGAAGVTAVVHSGYRRTRDTIAPLAEARELEPERIAARDAAALVQRMRDAKEEEVIVVAGHSNTVPALAWAFGVLLPGLEKPEMGPELPYGYLPHDAYDRVHVLMPGSKSARLLELRY